jgi:uncharacterized LabA/DUF88 family protein
MKRAICLIDGENLVVRYQEMLLAGRQAKPDNAHIKDTFIWNHTLLGTPVEAELLRVQYYTSVVGDSDRVEAVRNEIQSQMFTFGPQKSFEWRRLRGIVFKKSSKSKKTKNVDLQIVIDALMHSTSRHIETLYLVTGDGDFLPLVDEIMRLGIRVELFSLSSGHSKELSQRVDAFTLVDSKLFTREDA